MPTNDNPATSSLGVPIAVVIAGALIALAVYFSDGRSTPANVSPEAVNSPAVAAQRPPAPTVGDIRPIDDKDHAKGPANAKVTIIEYSDTECPFCKRFHATMEQVSKEFPNDMRWVYRHFPLDQLHQKARKESIAAECAGEQGKFWEMLDKIYEVTPSNDGFDLTTLPELARGLGVANVQQFEACLDSGKFDQRIEDDIADAQEAGGRGTPYSVIIAADGSKTPLNGAQPFEAVKAAIQQALDKK